MVAQIEIPPIPFDLVGYEVKLTDQKDPDTGKTVKVHAERVFTFHLRASDEFGPVFNVLVQTNADGATNVQAGMHFVAQQLVEEDKQRFIDTICRNDLHFEADAIVELAEALAERYGLRPTPPRSVRRSGPRHNGRTTVGGRSASGSS